MFVEVVNADARGIVDRVRDQDQGMGARYPDRRGDGEVREVGDTGDAGHEASGHFLDAAQMHDGGFGRGEGIAVEVSYEGEVLAVTGNGALVQTLVGDGNASTLKKR